MKAVRIHEHGDVSTLRYEEIPIPQPEKGQARVKIAAAGVNFIDIYKRKGLYPVSLPATLGMEGGGIVDALGPGVKEVRVGDRAAYAMETGSYAEYAVVDAWKLVPLPNEVDFQQGTAVMLQGLTAHYLSHSTFPLKKGDTALIHAAAGGVGQLLVQLAVMRGARVIATTSTPEKAKLAKGAGAHDVILYTQQDFAEEVKNLTKGRGVDVVYDSVGQETFWKSLDSLRPRGMMVLYGQSSGPVPPIDLQVFNLKGGLFVTRPSLQHYAGTREELLGRARDLFQWMRSKELRVVVDKTFPLQNAADAHRYLEARLTQGKVLLIP
ncbi:quinone oxidoreductase [Candidatus Acetothermia bacterium]|nr:quinone oxidoreductase [Candidatus Acetothermia bacterium]MBI3643692.1 quinone oxidoreductase [Candidatus Acetothermia bacterium]